MSCAALRVTLVFLGVALLAVGFWYFLESFQVVAGYGAFLDQWRDLQLYIDAQEWKTHRPSEPPPDDAWLTSETQGYFGHRLHRIVWPPLVVFFAGLALITLAILHRPRPSQPGPASDEIRREAKAAIA